MGKNLLNLTLWEYMSGWRSTILDPMSEAVRRAESLNLKGPK